MPSTITGFKLTTVLMLWGRVASAHAFIITGGPMAMTSPMSGCLAIARLMPSVTGPFTPTEPSSVHTMSSSQQLRNLSSQKISFQLRKPITPIT